jgi:predicted signal transduction protein with EAL and GGDEF domain
VVISALAHSGLSPRRLELEINESLFLAETEASLAILHQLRELGVSISMDDFGTGYSSLSYLRSFSFDKIKIDRSLVKDPAQRSDCVAIVRAISILGRSLNITTTAEGVETVDQLDWLRAEGCNDVQGFLFSAARPATEIEALLFRFGQRVAGGVRTSTGRADTPAQTPHGKERVSNQETACLAILRDAARRPLLRMRASSLKPRDDIGERRARAVLA